jgi:hypothetical protein
MKNVSFCFCIYIYILNRICSYSGSTHNLTCSSGLVLQQQGVCHTVAFPFALKSHLKAKEELRKLKYFTMQIYNLQKVLYRKPQSFKILELYN